MILTFILMRALTILHFIARHGDYARAPIVEEFALTLMGYFKFGKPMRKRKVKAKKPFYGKAVCESIDCKHTWHFYTKEFPNELPGVEIPLNCPACHEDTGWLHD